MTEQSARKAADVVLAVAALGAAYVVLRNPPLRRLAWRLAMIALTKKLPEWAAREVTSAWAETGQARRPSRGGLQ